jgi:hypothetical protein
MLLAGLVALLLILGLLFSALASPPKPDDWSGESTHTK